MPKQEKKTETRASKPHDDTFPEAQKPSKERTEALKADLDEVLDDIEAVLEENAEEFVNAYVQKGGQ